ncbi:hypothetical protein ACFPMF_15425 [Larkinella bovis]|uniref:DUF3408 domain-containing protein n=1 Tax=Larkinella bovis TaxID=683041 RepID=A0ABW0IBD9_9BACT
MAEQQSKTKLSDVAKQQHAAKASKFSAMMVPPPPVHQTPAPAPSPVEALKQESTPAVEEAPIAETPSAPEPVAAVAPATAPAVKQPAVTPKPVRSRKSAALSMDDVIEEAPPKGEAYPRQVRVSEVHHKLLRRLAFEYDKSINHILYNLLEQLDQAYQREQQKGGQ